MCIRDRIRKSPYFDSTVKWGATGFSVYNHMYIPRDFGDPEQNFWNLIETAILCDVAVERQVEITGPDAFKFIQLLTPRDLSKLSVGQCKYVLITNAEGGVLNDPVLLRLGENHFWLSLGDSDILLWAQGVAVNSGLNVKITEPDVSPLQLQGPKSGEIMIKLFGESIKDIKYYWFKELDLDGIPLIVSRNYNIPKWANKHTLVIVSSYSGDTEETLSAFDDALLKECQIIGITTGGALLKKISSNNLDHIIMPKGLQPRAALAYSFVPILYLFLELGLIEMDLHNNLINSVALLQSVRDSYRHKDQNNKTWTLSNKIYDTIPIIYC